MLPNTTSEYLKACGMAPDTHEDLWICQSDLQAAVYGWPVPSTPIPRVELGLTDMEPTPARAMEYACIIERFIVPEFWKRGLSAAVTRERDFAMVTLFDSMECRAFEPIEHEHYHIALLTAFYDAVKGSNDASN